MKKKIYLAVLNQGEIRRELTHLLHNLILQNKYDIVVSYPSDKPIANNRNKIVQAFLQEPSYDYLMMIDGDIVPPFEILNLVDFQKDIIGPLCFMYQQKSVIPLALKRKPDGLYGPMEVNRGMGLMEVDAIGTGCIILSRKVLEAVRCPFKNEYDADGIKLFGLDLAFCRRAKEKGFKVYSHFDYPCEHWTPMDLKKLYYSMADLEKRIKNNEI